MSKKQPWERLPSEPNLWWCRFEAFRAAGPKRSLLSTVNKERVKKGQEESNSLPGSWRNAAKTFRWHKRAQAWDAFTVAEDARRQEEERQAILQEGFALDHIRVRSLKDLATTLEEYAKDPNKLWLSHATENGVTESFNDGLVKQLRGVLDDIAAETGGRKRTTQNLNIDLDQLPNEALQRYVDGEDLVKILVSIAGGAK